MLVIILLDDEEIDDDAIVGANFAYCSACQEEP